MAGATRTLTCLRCKVLILVGRWHVDNTRPVSTGGVHERPVGVRYTRSCNSSAKRARCDPS
jgi:hypothetical protein